MGFSNIALFFITNLAISFKIRTSYTKKQAALEIDPDEGDILWE
jgi:hypothetical protein